MLQSMGSQRVGAELSQAEWKVKPPGLPEEGDPHLFLVLPAGGIVLSVEFTRETFKYPASVSVKALSVQGGHQIHPFRWSLSCLVQRRQLQRTSGAIRSWCRVLEILVFFQLSSVQSLSRVRLFGPHGLQHARPPCPSPTPRVYLNSCLLTQ